MVSHGLIEQRLPGLIEPARDLLKALLNAGAVQVSAVDAVHTERHEPPHALGRVHATDVHVPAAPGLLIECSTIHVLQGIQERRVSEAPCLSCVHNIAKRRYIVKQLDIGVGRV